MMEYSEARRIAAMLAAVGEPTRLLILYQLAQGPHHVGQLAEMLGVPMVNMSHHLGVMRQAGILDDEKDGRRVVYQFRPEIFTPGHASDPDTLGVMKFGRLSLALRRISPQRMRQRGPHMLRKPIIKLTPQPVE